MAQEELYARVAVLENKVEGHDKQLDEQNDKNDLLTRLTVISEAQVQVNKEQNKTMQKFDETLRKVNDNLTNLNSKHELLDGRVTGIESSIMEQQTTRKQRIVNTTKYVGSIVVGIFLAFLYKWLGL